MEHFLIRNTKYEIRNTTRGFSLIEAIIYISILSLLFVVVVHTTIVATKASATSRVKRSLAVEGHVAIERLISEIRLAHGVNEAGSVFGAHPGILALDTRVSASDNSLIIKTFGLNNSSLEIAEGGAAARPLSSGIDITRLVFYFIDDPNAPPAIRVEMTAENSFKTLTDTRNFYATAVLRGAY